MVRFHISEKIYIAFVFLNTAYAANVVTSSSTLFPATVTVPSSEPWLKKKKRLTRWNTHGSETPLPTRQCFSSGAKENQPFSHHLPSVLGYSDSPIHQGSEETVPLEKGSSEFYLQERGESAKMATVWTWREASSDNSY